MYIQILGPNSRGVEAPCGSQTVGICIVRGFYSFTLSSYDDFFDNYS